MTGVYKTMCDKCCTTNVPFLPSWIQEHADNLRNAFSQDLFDFQFKKASSTGIHGWKVTCLDCPGKLYNIGPGETLNNFEVHLKNRSHRRAVSERIKT